VAVLTLLQDNVTCLVPPVAITPDGEAGTTGVAGAAVTLAETCAEALLSPELLSAVTI